MKFSNFASFQMFLLSLLFQILYGSMIKFSNFLKANQKYHNFDFVSSASLKSHHSDQLLTRRLQASNSTFAPPPSDITNGVIVTANVRFSGANFTEIISDGVKFNDLQVAIKPK